MRQFRDAAGVEWQVYQADPQQNPRLRGELIPEAFRQGWLVFESPTEKRRLAPVPGDWQSLTPQELRRLCALATPTPARRGAAVDAEPARRPGSSSQPATRPAPPG